MQGGQIGRLLLGELVPNNSATSSPCRRHETQVEQEQSDQFFHGSVFVLVSVRYKRDALGHGTEFAKPAPPRHQQKKAEIEHGPDLRHAFSDGRRRQYTEVAQDKEVDHKDAVKPFVPRRAIADRPDRAVVQPRKEEHDDDRPTHHHDAPELSVDGQHRHHQCDRTCNDQTLDHHADLGLERTQHRARQHANDQRVHHFAGDRPKHRVVRCEVPNRRNVQWCFERVGGNEVIELQEESTEFGREEQDGSEHHQKDAHTQNVVHRVIRVERNAVQRPARRIFHGFYFHTIRVVRTHLVQCDDVSDHQTQQHQRDCDDVEGEESVQRSIADHIVPTDQQRQVRTYQRHGGEQIHDHLRAPVTHLAPRQQVTHESFCHQTQENRATEDPDQFAWLAITAVNQSAEHVQINDDEKRTGAGRVHVANHPAPRDIAHDVLDRGECQRSIGLVMHRQKYAGHYLHDQHEHRQCAEKIPEVKVLRCVVLGEMLFVQFRCRESIVDPSKKFFACACAGGGFVERGHVEDAREVEVITGFRPSCLRQ